MKCDGADFVGGAAPDSCRTTMGLIQSSFFWGYLVTWIAGGILAHTIGEKQVLAFGVIWWSVATALTSVAAKLGLSFLLVVRAFMGIGEFLASNSDFSLDLFDLERHKDYGFALYEVLQGETDSRISSTSFFYF